MDHYREASGQSYFQHRRQARAESTQQFRADLFKDLGREDRAILDFGCGTGGVLARVSAAERIGVEVNEASAAKAREVLTRVFDSLADVPPDSVDVAISCHALEHVAEPAEVLRGLARVVKPDGLVRVIVPVEMPVLLKSQRAWRANDPDMHLYSWTPLSLGNLMTVSGFEVVASALLPNSAGGKLGRIFAPETSPGRLVRYVKALATGKFQAAVTGRKNGASPPLA